MDQLIQCPFDPVHLVRPIRMSRHIAKCRKNHLGVEKKTCPFNAMHLIDPYLYQVHLQECPDRAIVERDLYRRDTGTVTEVEQTADNSVTDESFDNGVEEDWEIDVVTSSYDATQNCLQKEFTRPPPSGLGKAARRKWREKELRRVESLKRGLPIFDCSSSSESDSDSEEPKVETKPAVTVEKPSVTQDEICKRIMSADQPLRRPKARSMEEEGSVPQRTNMRGLIGLLKPPRIAADIFRDEDSDISSITAGMKGLGINNSLLSGVGRGFARGRVNTDAEVQKN